MESETLQVGLGHLGSNGLLCECDACSSLRTTKVETTDKKTGRVRECVHAAGG